MDIAPERSTTIVVDGDDKVERWPLSTDDDARLHSEMMSNWTGSPHDPVYDYLNIPLVKVI